LDIKKPRWLWPCAAFSSADEALFRFGGFDTILAVEALDASRGVYELLFSGKEGVASGTNFHLDALYRRTGLDNIAADASDGRILVLGVNSIFHIVPPLRRLANNA